jgi:hypothetical protein
MGAFWIIVTIAVICMLLWLANSSSKSSTRARSSRPRTRQQSRRTSAGGGGGADLALGVGIAIIAFLAIAAYVSDEIKNWFTRNRVKGSLGEMIRKDYRNGNYTLVTNVINKDSSTVVRSKEWRHQQLDRKLEKKFRKSNRIVIYE